MAATTIERSVAAQKDIYIIHIYQFIYNDWRENSHANTHTSCLQSQANAKQHGGYFPSGRQSPDGDNITFAFIPSFFFLFSVTTPFIRRPRKVRMRSTGRIVAARAVLRQGASMTAQAADIVALYPP